MLWAGEVACWLAMDDYKSAMSAHFKMAVVFFALVLLLLFFIFWDKLVDGKPL